MKIPVSYPPMAPPPQQAAGAAAPKLNRVQILAAIDQACRSGQFQKAQEIFKANFDQAQRDPQICFLVGRALFELKQYPLALQYLQQSAVAENAQNVNTLLMLARTHQKTGEFEVARRYAEQTYRMVPTENGVFDLLRQLSQEAGKAPPEHWLVIGCSHVRYFRYLQVNQPKFFEGAVHLECMEFGGATAFGLGNVASQSGALKATRDAQPRMRVADRVVVHFGEIDCRRAAWKAAAVENRPIEQTIADAAAHLEAYVTREILPHNRNVLLLGAKPQIIADDDFYKNSLEDERIVFKPLPERERITFLFNKLTCESAERLGIDYADIDHVLADEESRKRFFGGVFWDTYTTDTHGLADTFAALYCERLRPFIGKRRA